MFTVAEFALLSLASAVLHVPFRKVYHKEDSILAKRSSWTSDIRGNGLSYLAEVEVGTPAQTETVIIDTGSSDLWFATPETCNTDSDGIATSGSTYVINCDNVLDVTASTSACNTTIPFSISYADGSSSSGFYIEDTLTIAGTTIDYANFAYASTATTPSVLGIGFMLNEACIIFAETSDGDYVVSSDGCTPYENIPQQLKTQGSISSTAYSVWLNDLSEYEGNILFGGVDHAKYIGSLVTLPIEAEPIGYDYDDGSVVGILPDYTRALVTLNQIKLINEDGDYDVLCEGAIPVLLDTGSTECSLPSELVDSIATAFGASPDGYGGYYVNCGVSDSAYIAFNFRGLEIEVPFRQFIRPFTDNYGDLLVEEGTGIDYCYLGASADDSSAFSILGDNVLSSFYAVFDLENGEIALAPAIYDQDDTDIEDIVDSIPSAIQAPAYSYSFETYLEINPSPTLTFTMTPVTSVYGQTGTLVTAELTATAEGDAVRARATARFANIAYVQDTPDHAYTTTSSSSSAETDGVGITNIIGLAESLSLPSGISTVYSAGAPSTFSTTTSNYTATATATATSTSTDSTSTDSTTTSSTTSSSDTATTSPSASSFSNSTTSSTASTTSATTSTTSSTTSTTSATTSTTSAATSTTSATTSATTSTVTDSTVDSTTSTADSVTTITEGVTVLTTYCPEATTFTYGSSVYTVSEATTLTITYCTCTVDAVATTSSSTVGVTTVTDLTTVFTTYCPLATTFTYGGTTYSVTEATTLTITVTAAESSTTTTTKVAAESVSTSTSSSTRSSSSATSSTSKSSSSSSSSSTSSATEIATTLVAANNAVKRTFRAAMLLGALL